jgi:hypothetical protein
MADGFGMSMPDFTAKETSGERRQQEAKYPPETCLCKQRISLFLLQARLAARDRSLVILTTSLQVLYGLHEISEAHGESEASI